MRYYNEVEVDALVFKNLKIFKRGNKDNPKQAGDLLFDRISTASLNKHLNSLMPGLTAKVFRTFNASITFQVRARDIDIMAYHAWVIDITPCHTWVIDIMPCHAWVIDIIPCHAWVIPYKSASYCPMPWLWLLCMYTAMNVLLIHPALSFSSIPLQFSFNHSSIILLRLVLRIERAADLPATARRPSPRIRPRLQPREPLGRHSLQSPAHYSKIL